MIHLLIPASNIHTTTAELSAIEEWSASCNLNLNTGKTKEMIFMLPRAKMIDLPPEYPGNVRVREITILGIAMTDKFSMEPHVRKLCTRTAQSLYAFRLLRAHGLSGQRLYDIVVATAFARLTYATPAWVGYITADQKARIRASIRKLQRQDFLPSDQADFDDLCKKADIRLFHSILSNKHHVGYCINFLLLLKT
jgi:hypothetical protein